VHTQCAATPPLPDKLIEEMGWTSRTPFYDSRHMLYHLVLTPDNRIVIGGGNVDYYFNNGLHYTGDLRRIGDMMLGELTRLYPALQGVGFESVWNGALGMSYDETEAVGVMGEHRNIYYGLAYNGHGVNLSFLFGRIIADMYDKTAPDWEGVFDVDYALPRFPPEPFGWIGAQCMIRYYKWLDEKAVAKA